MYYEVVQNVFISYFLAETVVIREDFETSMDREEC